MRKISEVENIVEKISIVEQDFNREREEELLNLIVEIIVEKTLKQYYENRDKISSI